MEEKEKKRGEITREKIRDGWVGSERDGLDLCVRRRPVPMVEWCFWWMSRDANDFQVLTEWPRSCLYDDSR